MFFWLFLTFFSHDIRHTFYDVCHAYICFCVVSCGQQWRFSVFVKLLYGWVVCGSLVGSRRLQIEFE